MSAHARGDYLQRAQDAVQAGRLWRAKEILGGNLACRAYDLALYEAYGRLLSTMGDDVQAGRFLFLSGSQDPGDAGPVHLFLQKYGKNGWLQLVGTFPTAAKRTALAEYPTSVSEVLRGLGHPEQIDMRELHQRARRIRDARRKARRRPERARRRREAGRGLLAFALMVVVLWLLFQFLS